MNYPNPTLIGLLAAAMAMPTMAHAADEKVSRETKPFVVETVKDLVYYEGPNQHKIKHKLDLYYPKGLKNYPVLFFVHGGAWTTGDKDFFGVYKAFASVFAKSGIGVVVINYRLSPEVKHPDHVIDVARAFAWTVKNVAKHGGDKNAIFLCGHSAGAHLVSLLTADATFLKAHDLTCKTIRGVLPISGPFVLPGGFMPRVFGDDRTAGPRASPITHARKNLPPFLIVYADGDLIGCDKKPAEAFCKALKDKGNHAELLELKKANHLSILMNAGTVTGEVHQRIVQFIRKHSIKESK